MDIVTLQRDVEAVSDLYARRNGIERSDDWLLLKLGEEVGELTQAYLACSGQARDKGLDADARSRAFAAELADVLAHTLLIAERFGIDVPAEVEDKWLSWTSSRADKTDDGATRAST